MSFDETILNKLRDFEKEPPVSFFESIKQRSNFATDIAAPKVSNETALVELKEYSVNPPGHLYQRILNLINDLKQPAKVIKIQPYLKVAAIAASVLLITGIWKLVSKNEVEPVDNGVATISNTKPIENAVVQPQPDTTNKQQIAPAPKSNIIAFAGLKPKRITELPAAPDTFSIFIDGASIVVKDNDLYSTFTSLEYNNLPAFITAPEAKPFKLRIDKSTAINLSESMVAMMQKMYRTRSNGKPTRKAARMKKKMDKWKEADQTYFDKNVEKNPIDPIDLGEFLF